jgi:hypothetical protein
MRMLFFVFLSIFVFGETLAQSTYKRRKPKNAYAQGTLDFAWGYNRSAYSSSTIRFVGDAYDFRLRGVKAGDNQTPFSGKYFNPVKFTVPQYNVRLGYNFKNFWNLSFGFDHMKYVIRDAQEVEIQGFVNPGADPLWSGTFGNGQKRTLNASHFQYQNTDGLNYVRLQLSRVIAPFPKLRDGNFSINWVYGVSAGALVSFTDFTFEGYRTERVSSLSGYGLSLHSGLRFIFFKNFFLQGNLAGGIMHQVKAQTRPVSGSYASHVFTYGAAEGLFGFLFYIRPTNDCNSCPKW